MQAMVISILELRSHSIVNVQLELLNLTSDKLIHICLTIRLHTPNNLELS